jgi:two-component system sensor histidine kinase HydH
MTTEASSPEGSLARLAAGVAHELRNPLAVILARAQLLSITLRAGRAPDPEKLARTLATIEEQAIRASTIIENLSAFARPRPPDLKPVDLAELLDQVFAAVQARHRDAVAVRTDVGIDPGAAMVHADREQLATALTHLVMNAYEAVGARGVVRVDARPDGDGIIIRVADDGSGVAERDAERIFDPFFSTKRGAPGLGLPVVQTIAESHHGTLRLTAASQPGTEFVLSLPHARRSA